MYINFNIEYALEDFMKIKIKLLSSIITTSMTIGILCSYSYALNNGKYTRYYGQDRIATSIESAKTYSSDTLVIAPAYSYQDAISAMNIVNKFNGKLVLVGKGNTIDYFNNDSSIKNVYVVAGQSGDRIISNSIDNIFKSKAKVTRITGKDVYETNKKTLEISSYKTVGVATGEVYADALSAYGIAREENIGILLVNGKKAYNGNGYNIKYTFGGKNTVIQDGGERISGNDRYETSNKIAQKTNMKNVVFVDGRNYADSMSAVNITNSKKADIVLVHRVKNDATINISKQADELFVVGGPNSVEDAYIKQAIDGTIVPNTSQNNSGNIAINYADGLIRVNMPKNLLSNIIYKDINTVADEETAITFYSKYHYDKSSGAYKEGVICDLAVVDKNFEYPLPWVELGRVTKSGIEKKVVVFLPTEISFSDQSSGSINTYKKNVKDVFNILRNNIQGIDGGVYKKKFTRLFKKI